MELVQDFIKFATFGITIEVIFTALESVILSIKKNEPVNWNLKGKTYLWMIPIYGSIAFIAPVIHGIFQDVFILLRLFIYALIILAVEYVTGQFLKKLTGRCPWHYESKFAVHNVIRLDFLPFWMFFSYMVEVIYLYL